MAYRKIKGHTRKTERTERNREIYQVWVEHSDEMSLEDIGNRYGLCRQRIGQIIKRYREYGIAEEAEK